jgi:hypothetical protein
MNNLVDETKACPYSCFVHTQQEPEVAMRWINFAVCAALAATLCLSAEAAQPDAVASPGDDAITFEQYREWRLSFAERRRSELAVQLSAANLPERQKTRLEETRAYYDARRPARGRPRPPLS